MSKREPDALQGMAGPLTADLVTATARQEAALRGIENGAEPGQGWSEVYRDDMRQQTLLRRARKQLGKTNRELAAILGVKMPTLYAYLAPATAAKYRKLPAAVKAKLEKMIEGKR